MTAKTRADQGYCLFLAERMLDLVPRLRDEIDGVRNGEDVEAVHRMRVASRRLRAVLPLFSGCTGRRELRRWRRELRQVTRALGAARDTDVRIDFVLAFAARLPRASEPDGRNAAPPAAGLFPPIRALLPRLGLEPERRRDLEDALPAGPGPADQQGIACLLLRLVQQREALQPGVVAAMDRLEERRLLDRLADRAGRAGARARDAGARARSAAAFEAAHGHARLRCDEVLSLAPALRDPTRVAEHHAMRIATKRLRYTLETFAPLYDDGLKAELKALRRLQEALGRLHDCDVWIAELPVFLEEERARARAYFGHDACLSSIEPGVLQLLADRTAARARLHAAALADWEELERDRYVEGLIDRLAAARDEALLPSLPLRSIAEGTETARIALIADVHANLSALDAVARDAAARGAQAFINAGDSVGPGGDPDEVVRRLVALESVDIRGGSDRKAVRLVRGRNPDRRGSGSGQETPGPGWLVYLEGLPAERRFVLRGVRVRVAHRLPAGERHELQAGTGDTDPGELAGLAGAEIVVLGHPRRLSVRSSGGVHYVSPGSVGRSATADGSSVAEYALLQLFPFDLAFLSVPYDEDTVPAGAEPAGGGG